MAPHHLTVCGSVVRALGFGREIVGSNPTTSTSPEVGTVASLMGLGDRGLEPHHGLDSIDFRRGGGAPQGTRKFTNVLAQPSGPRRGFLVLNPFYPQHISIMTDL